ncbi:MAG: hypothetical protein ISS87_00865 [Candidatus Pacebacteria bacterium]|nr:hypothetical protein [Candidatus Paceibacterota bacterium]
MTKKIRVILLLICAILFLITAPSVILYSQGYRFDFKSKKIEKTGAFYFKIAPKQAEVYVNNQLEKRTDAFFNSAFIENLLPDKYFVEISKQDYLSWKKNLNVEKGKVTESKNIFLIPKTIKFETISKKVKDFLFSPNKKTMVLIQDVFDDENKDIWTLKSYDVEKNIKSYLVNENEISVEQAQEITLSGISWFYDNKNIILKISNNENIEYLALDLSKNPIFIKPLNLENINNLQAHPDNNQKVFFQKPDKDLTSIFEFNLEDGTDNLFLDEIVAYKAVKQGIFSLSEKGFLQKTDFSGNTQNLNVNPFPLKEKQNYEIYVFDSNIFLKQDNSLFYFDEQIKMFEKISGNVKSFSVSADEKKIYFSNDYEVWIMFLKEELSQPQREKQEKLLLAEFSEKIENIFWFNSHHLIFNIGNKIKIMEIDDRDELQIWDLVEFNNPKIYWNQDNRKLYILTDENLLVSQEL